MSPPNSECPLKSAELAPQVESSCSVRAAVAWCGRWTERTPMHMAVCVLCVTPVFDGSPPLKISAVAPSKCWVWVWW